MPPEIIGKAIVEQLGNGVLIRRAASAFRAEAANAVHLAEQGMAAQANVFRADVVQFSQQAVARVRGAAPVEGSLALKPTPPRAGLQVKAPAKIASFPVQEIKFARGQFTGMTVQQLIDGLRNGSIPAERLLSNQSFKDHVMYRHGPDARVPGKSRFVRNFDVREGIYRALRSPNTRVQMNMGENRGISFDYTFDGPIGHNSRRKPMPTIRVAVGWHGKVITAYPVR